MKLNKKLIVTAAAATYGLFALHAKYGGVE